MSNTANALARDRERFREYNRNRGSDQGWDTPDPRASFDTDPSDMSNDQLRKQHDLLLRLQKQELSAGNSHIAKDMARRRNDLWKEAERRDIHTDLG